MGCYYSWANLRCSSCLPLGEKSLWNGIIEILQSFTRPSPVETPARCTLMWFAFCTNDITVRNSEEIVKVWRAAKISRHLIKINIKFLLACGEFMIESSNGNIYRVTGHLCGKFTDHRHKGQWCGVTRSFDVFVDLRRHERHEWLSKQFIVPTLWVLANHSVTYFRCGPALWRQPWKSHKQMYVDEAWTTHGRAVGLPKQHSFCILSRLWSVAIHWHIQWSWLMTW